MNNEEIVKKIKEIDAIVAQNTKRGTLDRFLLLVNNFPQKD